MQDCLEIARTVLEKEIFGKKVFIPSGVTERHIQEIVFMFNYQLDPIFRNCQTSHKDLFKPLPLEIDCLILKIYMSTFSSQGATATESEQNSILFHEAKELGLVSRTCKVGEWPCSKLIDFRGGTEPCQEVKEKVVAKKWTNISLEDLMKSLSAIAMLVVPKNLMLVNSP